jgi:hypothetical protein
VGFGWSETKFLDVGQSEVSEAPVKRSGGEEDRGEDGDDDDGVRRFFGLFLCEIAQEELV